MAYAGSANHGSLNKKILTRVNEATGFGLKFTHVNHKYWSDGERAFVLERFEDIPDKHVLIFSSVYTDKLELQLRELIMACKYQYHAKTVTVVMSFMRYRRQDRQEYQHEITRLRWFIKCLKDWGVDFLIVCEPHNPVATLQFADEFNLPLFIAAPTQLFAQAIQPDIDRVGAKNCRMYSPDFGSLGRAIALAKATGTTVLGTPKRRINRRLELLEDKEFLQRAVAMYGTEILISCDLSDLTGLTLFMTEDEIDTLTTASLTADKVRRDGRPKELNLVATNPVCSPGWKDRLFPYGEPPPFDKIWLGNTRHRGDDSTGEEEQLTGGRVTEVDMAPAIAPVLLKVMEEHLKD